MEPMTHSPPKVSLAALPRLLVDSFALPLAALTGLWIGGSNISPTSRQMCCLFLFVV
jgi:hypothetical protein